MVIGRILDFLATSFIWYLIIAELLFAIAGVILPTFIF
jgi:uncharacterized integral membrane protein